jgi:glycerol-3-phosphate acyltransferase PlsY
MGSGNIGATNVTRVFGWYAGILTLLIDFTKGYLPLFLLHRYFPDDPWLLTVGAFSLVIGHCYSLFLKFHGGKGVATSLGCLLFVAPWCAAIAVLTYMAFLLITKISAVGSLGGIAAALIYFAFVPSNRPAAALVVGTALIVMWRHKDNIKRLVKTSQEK